MGVSHHMAMLLLHTCMLATQQENDRHDRAQQGIAGHRSANQASTLNLNHSDYM
jgi:hypothetical protein